MDTLRVFVTPELILCTQCNDTGTVIKRYVVDGDVSQETVASGAGKVELARAVDVPDSGSSERPCVVLKEIPLE